MDYRNTIIEALDVLRKRDIVEKESFKARAYTNVITQLKNRVEPIYSYKDVESIDGIGENISRKIREILETGGLKSAEKVKEQYNIEALTLFQNIYGVGPAKASELVTLGFTTIQQLRLADAVTDRKKSILNDKQRIGLKYYEDLLERIPRAEMEEHRDVLHSLLPADMENYTTEIVGSFRRGAVTSGDIDVLIRVPNGQDPNTTKKHLKAYVEMMKGFGYIEEVLALGEHKCMAISRIYNGKARRLDLLMTPDEEYAYAILYFTGSDKFNVAFRQWALDKGYTLNEHGLKPIREGVNPIPYMESENDIFKFLGLRYIEPSCRIDSKQIVSARSRPRVAKI